jgi:peptidoglycan/LPS O-acetylase OafA/YrhL
MPNTIYDSSGLKAQARTKIVKGSGSEFNVAAHALRGIASMMVFVAHILGGTAEHIYEKFPNYVALIQAPWFLGRWAVGLFFVISGFVILPSVLRYTPREFAWRRFMRLYPLFFFCSLVFIVLNTATNAYPKTNSIEAVFGGLLFLNLLTGTEQLTPNAWSLTFEVIFYIFTCVSVYFWVRKRNVVIALILAVVALLFMLRYPAAIYFFFGVVIRIFYDHLYKENRQWPIHGSRAAEAALFVIAIVSGSMYQFVNAPIDLGVPLAHLIMTSTIAYFLLAVGPNSLSGEILNYRPLLYLGTVSYSLYLIHPYTYFACRKLFEKFHLFGENWLVSMSLFILVATPVTLAATHIVHLVFERGPYNWVFHQRVYQKPAISSEQKNAP